MHLIIGNLSIKVLSLSPFRQLPFTRKSIYWDNWLGSKYMVEWDLCFYLIYLFCLFAGVFITRSSDTISITFYLLCVSFLLRFQSKYHRLLTETIFSFRHLNRWWLYSTSLGTNCLFCAAFFLQTAYMGATKAGDLLNNGPKSLSHLTAVFIQAIVRIYSCESVQMDQKAMQRWTELFLKAAINVTVSDLQ